MLHLHSGHLSWDDWSGWELIGSLSLSLLHYGSTLVSPCKQVKAKAAMLPLKDWAYGTCPAWLPAQSIGYSKYQDQLEFKERGSGLHPLVGGRVIFADILLHYLISFWSSHMTVLKDKYIT